MGRLANRHILITGVYKNFKRYFATRRGDTPACFPLLPSEIFRLYTEQMSSIVGGNSWHFHSLPAVGGGAYGASGCHLHTPGSQPYGALHRDRRAPGDLSRLARGRP